MVEVAGEFSPETKPKASSGEYFLRGWGRSGGVWVVNNPDGEGSGAGLVEGFLSVEPDAGARVDLRVISSGLVGVGGASRESGVGC